MKNITTKQFLKRLKKLYDEALEVAKNKNADYSGVDDPFKNFKIVEQLGITSVEVGIMTRMSDKMSRIATLLNKKENVKEESINDTLLDLSVYANILRIWLEENKNGKRKITGKKV